MGMFKDLRDLNKAGKEQVKKQGGMFNMMKTGLAQANEAVQQIQSDQELADSLATHGVDGQATIKSQVATGKYVNMQPELRFELSVDVNGFTSEQTLTQVVSPAVLGQLQPGAVVPCRVDPGDHSELMLALG